MEPIPYTCTNTENIGRVEIFENGEKINTIMASRCFSEWYCATYGYTWEWENGVDPDDPTTWPEQPEPPTPVEPPASE